MKGRAYLLKERLTEVKSTVFKSFVFFMVKINMAINKAQVRQITSLSRSHAPAWECIPNQ